MHLLKRAVAETYENGEVRKHITRHSVAETGGVGSREMSTLLLASSSKARRPELAQTVLQRSGALSCPLITLLSHVDLLTNTGQPRRYC